MHRFTHAQQLPATAATVITEVCTQAYLDFRYRDSEVLDYALEIQEDTPAVHAVCIRRTYSTEKIPRVARKLLGPRVEIVQSQRWQRQGPIYAGTMRVEVRGVPGHIEGQLRLEDQGPGQSIMRANGGIDVRVPLLGRQLEKLLAERAEEGFAKSMQALTTWLNSQTPQAKSKGEKL